VALRRLTTQLGATIAGLPPDDFNVSWALFRVLRCALVAATAEEAEGMWKDIEQTLAARPDTPFAGALAYALRGRPAPAPRMERLLGALDRHPRCGVRVISLSLLDSASDDAARMRAVVAGRTALRSPCWRMKAEGLAMLQRLGVAPDSTATLPLFLRAGVPAERK
jgi:hypothetical protein